MTTISITTKAPRTTTKAPTTTTKAPTTTATTTKAPMTTTTSKTTAPMTTAAPTTTSTPVATAAPVTSSSAVNRNECPKCILIKKTGKRSCCYRGGAWFKKCGNPGDRNFEHTWNDGIRACKTISI